MKIRILAMAICCLIVAGCTTIGPVSAWHAKRVKKAEAQRILLQRSSGPQSIEAVHLCSDGEVVRAGVDLNAINAWLVAPTGHTLAVAADVGLYSLLTYGFKLAYDYYVDDSPRVVINGGTNILNFYTKEGSEWQIPK